MTGLNEKFNKWWDKSVNGLEEPTRSLTAISLLFLPAVLGSIFDGFMLVLTGKIWHAGLWSYMVVMCAFIISRLVDRRRTPPR